MYCTSRRHLATSIISRSSCNQNAPTLWLTCCSGQANNTACYCGGTHIDGEELKLRQGFFFTNARLPALPMRTSLSNRTQVRIRFAFALEPLTKTTATSLPLSRTTALHFLPLKLWYSRELKFAPLVVTLVFRRNIQQRVIHTLFHLAARYIQDSFFARYGFRGMRTGNDVNGKRL